MPPRYSATFWPGFHERRACAKITVDSHGAVQRNVEVIHAVSSRVDEKVFFALLIMRLIMRTFSRSPPSVSEEAGAHAYLVYLYLTYLGLLLH